jgi:uncharacterized protein (DUF2235 family)
METSSPASRRADMKARIDCRECIASRSRVVGGGTGIFGWGLDQAVVAAYEWLMDAHSEGDEIFNFGFSRGAYTARSLAGLISKRGLLIPGVHIVRQPSPRAISKWRPSVDLRARVDG